MLNVDVMDVSDYIKCGDNQLQACNYTDSINQNLWRLILFIYNPIEVPAVTYVFAQLVHSRSVVLPW